jgi:uncharacterized protein YcnI
VSQRILRRLGRRLLAVTIGVFAIIVAMASPAFAHVTVDPSTAPQGAEVTLGFRVPNEMANAGTVRVQVFFPSNHPVLGVDPQSVPGWHDTIHTASLDPPVRTDDGLLTEYVSEVDWAGGPIQPGHFQNFYVLAQSLPSGTNEVVFKALQTYSNGTVVRWIDPVSSANPDPPNPAPILRLTAPVNDSAAVGSASGPSSGSDSTALTIGVVGLVVGAFGLGLATWALLEARRARRSAS